MTLLVFAVATAVAVPPEKFSTLLKVKDARTIVIHDNNDEI